MAVVSPPEGGVGGEASPLDPVGGTSSTMAGGSGTGGASNGGSAPGSGGSDARGGTSAGSGGVSGGSGGSGGKPGGGAGGKVACKATDEICDGLDNDCDGEIDDNACEGGCHGLALAGKTYIFCFEALQNGAAVSECREQGMHLAWLETKEEAEAVLEAVVKLWPPDNDDEQHQARLGGTDQADEGHWVWGSDGELFWEHDEDGNDPSEGEAVDGAFVNWSEGRPNDNEGNQDCVAMMIEDGEDGTPGQWNDIVCSDEIAFICEKP
jgi:hypothetical protein